MNFRTIETSKGDLHLIMLTDLQESAQAVFSALMHSIPNIYQLTNIAGKVEIREFTSEERIAAIAMAQRLYSFFFIEYAFADTQSCKVWATLPYKERFEVMDEYVKYGSFEEYVARAVSDFMGTIEESKEEE